MPIQIKILERLIIYLKLMRINQPIGLLLLLWPTVWALWLSNMGTPDINIFITFILGVFFSRSTGCVINDFYDRKIDKNIKRTANRPIPSGMISKQETKILFIFLTSILFFLVLRLHIRVIILSFIAFLLILIYPLMKRYIHVPQVVLGVAFSLSILMVFFEKNYYLPLHCWLLFIANVCWTISYDTQYAMVDKDDDLCIGVKSTAILFGKYDKMIIAFFQTIMISILWIIGWKLELNSIFFCSLIGAIILFIRQHILIFKRVRSLCFQSFLNNNYVGMLIFIGIKLGLTT